MSTPRRSSLDSLRAKVHKLRQYSPRRMRIADAAHYMAVSESTFRNRVDEAIYPPGQKEGGVVLWLRDDLDLYIDRQFGVASSDDGSQGHNDPFAARFQRAG